MEVKYFLDRRTRFIRDFYDKSAAPFLEVVRKIEAEEAPYETPPGYGYDHDGEYVGTGEPAFMAEWQDALYAIQIQGRTCLRRVGRSQPDLYRSSRILCNRHSWQNSGLVFWTSYIR